MFNVVLCPQNSGAIVVSSPFLGRGKPAVLDSGALIKKQMWETDKNGCTRVYLSQKRVELGRGCGSTSDPETAQNTKHGSGTCATRPRTMQSADNNFFQLRSTFTARAPPRRTPHQQSTRFCLDTWRVYPVPSTLIIIHLICLGLHPIVSRKHPFMSDCTGARNASTRHHPPKHRTV